MPGTSTVELGKRLKAAAAAAHLTQAQLADASGVSLGMVRQIMQGHRTPSDNVLDCLARAVSVTPEELLGDTRRSDSRVHLAVPAIQAAISAYDLPDDGPVRPLRDLAAAVQATVDDRVNSRYAALAAGIAPLLEELFRAVDQTTGRDRQQAAHLLALAIRSADAAAYKAGHRDLSARLVELMRWAAQIAEDPALTSAAAYVRMETFFSTGQLDLGLRSLRAAADRMPAPTTTGLAAAAAALHMRAAVVAGRMQAADESREHLAEADRLAAAVPEQLYDGTAVGPESLRIHRLAVAVELGDPAGLAPVVAAAGSWAPSRALPAERRSHFYIDLGRAQMRLGRPAHAHESFQVARQIAPQHVREHGQVRAELATLVRLTRGRDERVLAMAQWAKAV